MLPEGKDFKVGGGVPIGESNDCYLEVEKLNENEVLYNSTGAPGRKWLDTRAQIPDIFSHVKNRLVVKPYLDKQHGEGNIYEALTLEGISDENSEVKEMMAIQGIDYNEGDIFAHFFGPWDERDTYPNEHLLRFDIKDWEKDWPIVIENLEEVNLEKIESYSIDIDSEPGKVVISAEFQNNHGDTIVPGRQHLNARGNNEEYVLLDMNYNKEKEAIDFISRKRDDEEKWSDEAMLRVHEEVLPISGINLSNPEYVIGNNDPNAGNPQEEEPSFIKAVLADPDEFV